MTPRSFLLLAALAPQFLFAFVILIVASSADANAAQRQLRPKLVSCAFKNLGITRNLKFRADEELCPTLVRFSETILQPFLKKTFEENFLESIFTAPVEWEWIDFSKSEIEGINPRFAGFVDTNSEQPRIYLNEARLKSTLNSIKNSSFETPEKSERSHYYLRALHRVLLHEFQHVFLARAKPRSDWGLHEGMSMLWERVALGQIHRNAVDRFVDTFAVTKVANKETSSRNNTEPGAAHQPNLWSFDGKGSPADYGRAYLLSWFLFRKASSYKAFLAEVYQGESQNLRGLAENLGEPEELETEFMAWIQHLLDSAS